MSGTKRTGSSTLPISKAAQCEAMGARWPRIDVLLNVVGYVHHGTILDCTPEDWARLVDARVDAIISDDPASLIAWLKEKKLR